MIEPAVADEPVVDQARGCDKPVVMIELGVADEPVVVIEPKL